MAATYRTKDVTITLNGLDISGLCGDIITIKREEPMHRVILNGVHVRTHSIQTSRDEHGTCTSIQYVDQDREDLQEALAKANKEIQSKDTMIKHIAADLTEFNALQFEIERLTELVSNFDHSHQRIVSERDEAQRAQSVSEMDKNAALNKLKRISKESDSNSKECAKAVRAFHKSEDQRVELSSELSEVKAELVRMTNRFDNAVKCNEEKAITIKMLRKELSADVYKELKDAHEKIFVQAELHKKNEQGYKNVIMTQYPDGHITYVPENIVLLKSVLKDTEKRLKDREKENNDLAEVCTTRQSKINELRSIINNKNAEYTTRMSKVKVLEEKIENQKIANAADNAKIMELNSQIDFLNCENSLGHACVVNLEKGYRAAKARIKILEESSGRILNTPTILNFNSHDHGDL